MKGLNLNISKFKKLYQDQTKTTLENPSGHQIVISHKNIHPKFVEQLKALPIAEGTIDKPVSKIKSNIQVHMAEGGQVGFDAIKKENYKKSKKMSDGGSVKKSIEDQAKDDPAIAEKENKNARAETAYSAGFRPATTIESQAKTDPAIAESEYAGARFSDGGQASPTPEATDSPKIDPEKAKAFTQSFNQGPIETLKQGWQNTKKELGFANGTPDEPVQPAETSTDQPKPNEESPSINPMLQTKRDIYNSLINPQASVNNQVAKVGIPNPEGVTKQMFGPNGEEPEDFNPDVWHQAEQNYTAQSQAAQRDAGAQQARLAMTNQMRVRAGLSPLPGELPTNPSANSQMPAQDQSQSQASPMDAYSTNMVKGFKQEGEGIKEQAVAQGALGKQQAATQSLAAGAISDQIAQTQQQQAKANEEYDSLMHDARNGYIKPNQVMENMGATKKVMTGIGLMLSGIGSGVTGGPNLAWEGLQHQIDRDMQAQMHNMAHSENLLSHNVQHMNSLQDGAKLTYAMINGYYAHLIDQAAATAASPMAKAQADILGGQLKQKAAFFNSQVGLNTGGGQGTQFPLMNRIQMMKIANPEMAKDLESRYVPMPGGRESLALTPKDADAMKEQLSSINPIFQQLDRIDKLGASALIPGTTAHNQAQAMRAELVPMINENAGLKRLSAEDIANISSQIKDPTKFSQFMGGKARSDTLRNFLLDKIQAASSVRLEGGGPRIGTSNRLNGTQNSPNNAGFAPNRFKPIR